MMGLRIDSAWECTVCYQVFPNPLEFKKHNCVIDYDPNGKDAHEPGAKLDAGKVRPGLVLGSFARALLEVCKIGTDGAAKYTDNGWLEVPNGSARYEDAGLRHWLRSHAEGDTDPESGSLHLAHEAWNALARLELYLRNQEDNNGTQAEDE